MKSELGEGVSGVEGCVGEGVCVFWRVFVRVWVRSWVCEGVGRRELG